MKHERKVLGSFSELGAAMGIRPAESPTPKAKKCRKCGTVMTNVPGTNVWLCSGKTQEGKPCTNRALSSVAARATS